VETNSFHQRYEKIIDTIRCCLIRNYGFVADPSLTTNHNAAIQLSELPAWYYFCRPFHVAFHNLCVNPSTEVPPLLRSILGLGLNFCLQPRLTSGPDDLFHHRFQRDVAVKIFFAGGKPLPNTKLFVSSNWAPNPRDIPKEIQHRIGKFVHFTKALFTQRQVTINLLDSQSLAIRTLRASQLHVFKTDKNLGPAVIERSEYIRRALVDHLYDQYTYRQLTKDEALSLISTIELQLLDFERVHFPPWLTHRDAISKAHYKFLRRSRIQGSTQPFGHFYLLAKIHKSPCKTRPIISCSGSLLHGLGRWVDNELQRICKHLPFALQSSAVLVQELLELGPLPLAARFFTCDASSMYTNIDTEHALEVIGNWLHESPIPKLEQVNVTALLMGLRLVMSFNVFCFGDSYWHQLTGTAMGTPPAPMYATLYFFIHEEKLHATYNHHLLYYRRYIDDGFGIWLPNECDTTDKCDWDNFKRDFDKFGSLTWEFSDRTTKVDFLDVTITIQPNQQVQTCLFEKALNLYLYLPSHSAHPPGVLKGLIIGTFRRIQRLTSDSSLRLQQARKLYERLRLRGYTDTLLSPIFQDGIQSLSSPPTKARSNNKHSASLMFLHVPFHPLDPPSQEIQRLARDIILSPNGQTPFGELCNANKAPIAISRLVVAYHRPRNLGNILSPRQFSKHGMSVVAAIRPDRQATP
jgi:hypothetical protein